MSWATMQEFKEVIKGQGDESHAAISDADMGRVIEILDSDPHCLDTPSDELRYIEGLLELPLGYLPYFRVIFADGGEQCNCGRKLSALDLVKTALNRSVHTKDFMADVLGGDKNIIFFSDSPHTIECNICGNSARQLAYHTPRYVSYW